MMLTSNSCLENMMHSNYKSMPQISMGYIISSL